MCILLTCVTSSISLWEEDRETESGRTVELMIVLGVTHMHALSVSAPPPPPSQFKPDEYIHHVFRRYYPSLPPSLFSPSPTVIIIHLITRETDGEGLRDREDAHQMTKYCLLRLSIAFDVLFRQKSRLHYCLFVALLLQFPLQRFEIFTYVVVAHYLYGSYRLHLHISKLKSVSTQAELS